MIKTTVPLKAKTHDHLIPEREAESCGIIVFGATGDLAHRKLIPALYDLYHAGLLPKNFYILGSGLSEWNDTSFRKLVLGILKEKNKPDLLIQRKFTEHIYYYCSAVVDPEGFKSLGELIEELNTKHKTKGNITFYFATSAEVYSELVQKLAHAGLISRTKPGKPWIRAVFEKPFGHDLESARQLNKTIHKFMDESQIYRIDHYLGKETVQNILLFRFSNVIFEPLWNRHYIDHVQITASETLGVEQRAGYYDKAGQLRDMFQNHMFQLLTLVAMESPNIFEAKQYHDEKLKVAEAIRPIPAHQLHDFVAFGQYGAGHIGSHKVPAYRHEEGVPPHSKTETFAALKIMVDTPRWKDVPFYLRSGKRLNHNMTEISIHFKKIPLSIFPQLKLDQFEPNVLSFRIQPDEGIFLSFEAKYPGAKLRIASLNLAFNYKDIFKTSSMGPYERLLLDCLKGDQMLFVREDMVEVSWKFISSILKNREKLLPRVFPNYKSGSWGPESANKIIQQDGRKWHDF